RVPLIVRWPGIVKPGSRCSTPVQSIDFYPTLLDVTGAKRPAQPLDGESLLPLLKQTGTLNRKAVFWHFPAYLQANRNMRSPWRTTPAGSVRSGDWKLIEFFEEGRLELYNLKDDVGERSNLANKLPGKTRELHRLMKDWRAAIKAPVPTKKNPKYDPTAKPKKRKRRK
ncbi:MAG: sulfatase/phosphatase domain-containing protein, partial [Planctomycetaceae bacterium]